MDEAAAAKNRVRDRLVILIEEKIKEAESKQDVIDAIDKNFSKANDELQTTEGITKVIMDRTMVEVINAEQALNSLSEAPSPDKKD